jgi:putative ABC transport system substrate-binding protein
VLSGKRLELLKETIPGLSRVAILWNPEDPASREQWKETQVPARELALQLYSMEVRKIDRYESALDNALEAGSAALAVASSSFFNAHQRRIAELAAKKRLPSISNRREFVTSGGLISYGPDRIELYTRVVAMVDKILKGRKPVDIPVEQPTRFELMINLKTAKQIDVTIPPNMLARADRVIR